MNRPITFSSLLSLRPRAIRFCTTTWGFYCWRWAARSMREAAFACASMLVPSWVEARFNRAVAAEEMGSLARLCAIMKRCCDCVRITPLRISILALCIANWGHGRRRHFARPFR